MRRAVLFDLYDTLVRVDIATVMRSRARIAEAFGVDVDRFQALWNQHLPDRLLGVLGTLEDEIRAIVGQLERDGESRAVDVALADDGLVAALAAADRRAWVEAARPYPDAMETLAALRRRGHAIGLVSNCSCQATDVIRSLGLDDYLDGMALSFELGVAKPDPAIFLAACERIGARPDECVFVADGAGGELEAAAGLGMLAVWIDRPEERRRASAPPVAHARIGRLSEALALDELTDRRFPRSAP